MHNIYSQGFNCHRHPLKMCHRTSLRPFFQSATDSWRFEHHCKPKITPQVQPIKGESIKRHTFPVDAYKCNCVQKVPPLPMCRMARVELVPWDCEHQSIKVMWTPMASPHGKSNQLPYGPL